MHTDSPGKRWILYLGIAGFAAGFLGPLVFVPEANQGPMVGIFISGPAGFLLGTLLWGLCALIKPVAQTQWRMLYAIATLGVVITLLCVQPEPRLLGYIFEGEVQSCASPAASEEAVIAEWEGQVAKYSYAEPRAGWRDHMRRLLRDAPGVVLTVHMQRQNSIRENRKPWNRGSQFSSGWAPQSQDTSFYVASGSCDSYAKGNALRGFQVYDADERIDSARAWPPATLLGVLGASALAPVPAKWAGS